MILPKYTVRLLFDVPGWAYHRRCQALQKYAPDDFAVTIGPDYGRVLKAIPHDLVLQLCYACSKNIRDHVDQAGYDMVVVTGINVAWKSGASWFPNVYRYSHHVIFNSKMAWEEAGRQERTSWISNGVDGEIFRPIMPIGERKPRVISIGSDFHRKNKGFMDILPHLVGELGERGIDCDFRQVNSHGRERVGQETMNSWYNTGTIYVVASEREGTPNPALEAAAAGCVLVSTRVGNMVELIEDGVNGFLVERNLDAIHNAVLKAQANYPRMAAAMQERIADWHWRTRAQEYFALFRELIDRHRAARINTRQESLHHISQ